jgi:hypothetical protein
MTKGSALAPRLQYFRHYPRAAQGPCASAMPHTRCDVCSWVRPPLTGPLKSRGALWLVLADATGAFFQALLQEELRKVSQFFASRVDRFEATLQRLMTAGADRSAAAQLTSMRAEAKELNKFVALNYLAVRAGGAASNSNQHPKDSQVAARGAGPDPVWERHARVCVCRW